MNNAKNSNPDLEHRSSAPRTSPILPAGLDRGGVGIDQRHLGLGKGLLEADLVEKTKDKRYLFHISYW